MIHRIEAAHSIYELVALADDMIRKYCLLVKNYSLRGYSEMIRRVINYIDFNLQEDLKLSAIASVLNVNASYLSGQFKKEMGKSLTEYVNEKRISASFPYLATTGIPIAVIAEKVGIYDENYFTKLFKRCQGMTPREYRQLMQENH